MSGKLDVLLQLAEEKSRYGIEVMQQEHDCIALVDSGGSVSVVSISISSENAKNTFIPMFSTLLRKLNAECYVLISEAWATTSNRPRIEGIPVSELPLDDRDEILQLMAVENKGSCKGRIAVIDNTPHGRKLREFKSVTVLAGRLMVKEW